MCVALAASTAFSVMACGGDKKPASNNNTSKGTSEESSASILKQIEGKEYDEASGIIYNAVLGDFKAAYDEAKKVTDNNDERYAKMAIAEAKMLESGIMCPTQGNGGNYRFTRVAPYSAPSVQWGLEEDKKYQYLVVDDKEFLKTDEVNEMKAKWAEDRGKGTFRDWEMKYLKDKGYKLKDELSITYSSDPKTWDCLGTSLQADTDPVLDTIDPLVGYNVENEMVGKLAESWEESDDHLTYTFHIRKGLKWVDNQQREVGDLTADDFVAGMQHMCDAKGGLESLISGVIKNAKGYIDGDIVDFNEVGVKAVDDYTLEYTLEEPVPYFLSMFGYSIFMPMNREYYTSKGGKFGQEYDNSSSDYKYGKTPEDIAYCGAFVIKSYTAKNSIVYEANKNYWDKKNQTVKKVNWRYTDGQDPTKLYKDAKSGTTDAVGLTQEIITMAKEDGRFDKYASTSNVDGTTFVAFYNLNRAIYHNSNNEKNLISPKSDEDKERTRAAMLNRHFRLALSYAFDRQTYRAQRAGDDLKATALKNLYTGWNLVYTENEVTVKINGKDVTFEAGTPYAKMVQAQLDADGFPVKAYDEKADDGNGSGVGYDGWYNVDNAKKELATAIEELGKEGVTVDADHPIYVDVATNSAVSYFKNQAMAYKKAIESATDKKVIVNVIETANFDDWGYSGYYCQKGDEMNYDMFDFSGWGPDYGDPSTFLDTLLPEYSGYMCKCLGIY
ncbi:oligopeptide transport system substrate-binding protein [Lachnospiraceae bacterium XBB1006]|nr:oligopeptide transport system substrate-binding protein [Lachnospiraceae bacterium XBB1006]